jgi:hypothetical protein|tara:strand:- start:287 stop:517 length:231 start_codon:yes stop_codon:yes gene_type:complete
MTNEYQKVEDHPELLRDKHSGAIINNDHTAYQRAIARANSAQKQRDDLRDATREINNIKCEMHEIKSLLKQLVSKE